MTDDELTLAVEKLTPDYGDLVLVKVPDESTAEQRERIGQSCSMLHRQFKAAFVQCPASITLEHVTEEQMKRIGWERCGKSDARFWNGPEVVDAMMRAQLPTIKHPVSEADGALMRACCEKMDPSRMDGLLGYGWASVAEWLAFVTLRVQVPR